jgi:hypothetical protein
MKAHASRLFQKPVFLVVRALASIIVWGSSTPALAPADATVPKQRSRRRIG